MSSSKSRRCKIFYFMGKEIGCSKKFSLDRGNIELHDSFRILKNEILGYNGLMSM
jgi:hypothetical protein